MRRRGPFFSYVFLFSYGFLRLAVTRQSITSSPLASKKKAQYYLTNRRSVTHYRAVRFHWLIVSIPVLRGVFLCRLRYYLSLLYPYTLLYIRRSRTKTPPLLANRLMEMNSLLPAKIRFANGPILLLLYCRTRENYFVMRGEV